MTQCDHNVSPVLLFSLSSVMFYSILHTGRSFYKLPQSSVPFHLTSPLSIVDLNILAASIDDVYKTFIPVEVSPKLDLL